MHITGVPETTFREIGIEKFISSPDKALAPGHKSYPLQIKNCKTNKVFECGVFELKSLSELMDDCKRMDIPTTTENECKFIIVTAEDPENVVNEYIMFLIFILF